MLPDALPTPGPPNPHRSLTPSEGSLCLRPSCSTSHILAAPRSNHLLPPIEDQLSLLLPVPLKPLAAAPPSSPS